jgi:HEAT repeat protein
MDYENIQLSEPYKGLRPYQEENRDIFFGREEERDILIDKMFSSKLTLLFANTGVGKSSLIQAAVMPQLKSPERENLDVVYYNDWVLNPLEMIKDETLRILREQGKIEDDYTVKWGIPLDKFFRMVSVFTSDPLVVILDQFEEFFQYHSESPQFSRYIKELARCFKDRASSATFLISMREDFALELNAFKGYLTSSLFDNFFRLEKLDKKKAHDAICKPVERLGFQYEEELVEEILKDLAGRERANRTGRIMDSPDNHAPQLIEPPYLQIICSQLWEEQKDNPDRIIKLEAFTNRGGARGFVDSYFSNVLKNFSHRQQKIASKAFSYLITPRGTKIAYPQKDLSDLLKVREREMKGILQTLEKKRVLRGQIRKEEKNMQTVGQSVEGKEEMWYELYHDIFSKIISEWNRKFKSRERTKRVSFAGGSALTLFLAMFIYFFLSLSSYVIRPQQIDGNGMIELYKKSGKLEISSFEAEIGYRQYQFEIDQRVRGSEEIPELNQLKSNIISRLPRTDRISVYFETGDINDAYTAIEASIKGSPEIRKKALELLAGFGSKESYERLTGFLDTYGDTEIRKDIIKVLGTMKTPRLIQDLEKFLDTETNMDDELRFYTAEWLARKNEKKGLQILVEFLESDYLKEKKNSQAYDKQQEVEIKQRLELKSRAANVLCSLPDIGSFQGKSGKHVATLLGDTLKLSNNKYHKEIEQLRIAAAGALGHIGGTDAVHYLSAAANNDRNTDVRLKAVEALGRIGTPGTVKPLGKVLNNDDQDVNVRRLAAKVLGKINSKEAAAPLIEVLKNWDYQVRRYAAQALGNIKDEQAIAPLIAALTGDKHRDVRHDAAQALIKINCKKAVPLLGKTFYNNRYKNARQDVADVLVRMGCEKSVKPLIDAFDHNDYDIRQKAVNTFGPSNSKQVVKQLIEAVKNKNSSWLKRFNAAVALGRMKSKEAVEPLMEVLADRNPKVVYGAVIALGQTGDANALEPLIERLKSKDKIMRFRCAEALGLIGNKEAVEPLITALEDEDARVRQYAAQALGLIGSPKAEDHIITALKDEDRIVRQGAAEALGQIGSNKSVEHLIAALRDEDETVRQKAAESIDYLNIKGKTTRLLIEWIKTIQNVDEKRLAVRALGRTGSSEAVTPLTGMLEDADNQVRRIAAHALGRFGHKSAVKHLIQCLEKDKDIEVKRNVIEALGRIGDEKAIEHLFDQLERRDNPLQKNIVESLCRFDSKEAEERFIFKLYNEDKNVQHAAVIVLGRIGSEKAVPFLTGALKGKSRELRRLSIEALSRICSEKEIKPLITALQDNDFYMRSYAALALGRIGSENETKPLIAALKDKHTDVRINAALALGRIGCKEAVGPLIETMNDVYGDVRSSASRALGRIGNKKAEKSLINALLDENPEVRKYAAQALGQIDSKKALVQLRGALKDNNRDVSRSALISLGKIFPIKYADEIKQIFNNPSEDRETRTAAAVLLKAAEIEALFYLERILKTGNTEELTCMAGIIGETQSKKCIPLLENMLKHKAAAIREAAVEALAQIASPDTIDILYKKALDTGERKQIRLKAVAALGQVNHVETLSRLMELFKRDKGNDEDEENISFKALAAIGRMKSIQSPPQGLKKLLLKKLESLEEEKAYWRRIRGKGSNDYDNEHLEFQLAYVISRLDKEKGCELLSNDLANVRHGASMALGRSEDAELVTELYRIINDNNRPWIRNSAYRALDMMLTNIEDTGGQKELTELDGFLKKYLNKTGDKNIRQAVKTRTEWTIDRLTAKVVGKDTVDLAKN